MKDNYFASVGAIVIHNGKVLLVRHTYGSAKGKLLNPGGHLNEGELPFDAVKREVMEETGIIVEPVGMLSVRCSRNGWYMVCLAEYVSGEPKSDNHENSEALFMDCEEALAHPNTTDTLKTHLAMALNQKPLLPVDTGKERILFGVGNK